MNRPEQDRFDDILHAIERCQHYAPYLRSDEFSGMAYDAVLRNLAVIGEAVRALPEQTPLRNAGDPLGGDRRTPQRRGARVLPRRPRAHSRRC